MSIALQVDDVESVLLLDGLWYRVDHKSFGIDSYEYIWGEQVLHGGGQSGITAAGFYFSNKEYGMLAGPLSSIVAVKYKVRKRKDDSSITET